MIVISIVPEDCDVLDIIPFPNVFFMLSTISEDTLFLFAIVVLDVLVVGPVLEIEYPAFFSS